MHLIIFIVPCPCNNGWSPSHALNLLSCFELKVFQIRRIGGIAGASELEVVPDEDTKLIACIQQSIVFINAATPYTDHYLVTVGHEFDPIIVALGRNLGQIAIGRDPARASAEYINIVDSEIERFAICIWLLDECCSSEAGQPGE